MLNEATRLRRPRSLYESGLSIARTRLLLLACAAPRASEVPSNARAERAALKQLPRLQAELSAAGLELGASIFIRILKQSAQLEF